MVRGLNRLWLIVLGTAGGIQLDTDRLNKLAQADSVEREIAALKPRP